MARSKVQLVDDVERRVLAVDLDALIVFESRINRTEPGTIAVRADAIDHEHAREGAGAIEMSTDRVLQAHHPEPVRSGRFDIERDQRHVRSATDRVAYIVKVTLDGRRQ